MNLSIINSIQIWQPSDDKEYLETLNTLSISNKRWIVGSSGKIAEVNFFVFILEKIKALFLLDHTNKKLLDYHVIKLFEYGHNHDLLSNQEEKIQKIAQKMNWGREIILQDLFEQIKSPIEIKIDRISERLSLYIKREMAKEKHSFSRAFQKINEKFEWGLFSREIFEKISHLSKDWQKEWEPRPEQVKNLLLRKESTEDYLQELDEFFEKLLYRGENFYKNLETILTQNKVKIFFKCNGLKHQLLTERGLFAHTKGFQDINASIDSILNNEDERETLLHMACGLKDFPLVKWLLKKGANPNVTNTDTESPLTLALKKKSTEIARFLIEKGINIHFSDSVGNSHLIDATRCDNLEIVKLLKEKGANVNQESCTGANALSSAIWIRNSDVINYLIENGANLDNKFVDKFNCEQALYFAQIPTKGEVKEETIELWKRIFLANCWTLTHSSPFMGENIFLLGGSGREGLYEIIRRFTDFQNQFFKGKASVEFVRNFLNEDRISPENPKECLDRFEAGKPLLLYTGFGGHRITILYYGSYLLILNRGQFARDYAIFIKKIDRQKAHLREKDWKSLLKKQSPSLAERFFYQTLPILSGALKEDKGDTVTDALHQFFMSDQWARNGWLVSPKLLPLAILAISNLIDFQEKQPMPYSKIGSYFYKRQQNKIINQAYYEVYKPFTSFLRLDAFKTYLKEAVENKKAFGRDSIESDHELIQKVMGKYRSKYCSKFSIFKKMEQEIEVLYQKYLNLFEKKPLPALKLTVLRILRNFRSNIQFRKHIYNTKWLYPYFLNNYQFYMTISF